MIDLTADTFIPELVTPCVYAGFPSVYGCVMLRNYEHGRPGVSGEFSPESRSGSANHALICMRMADPVFEGREPAVGDSLSADGSDWRVRIVRKGQGGSYELLCEESGSRAVNWERSEPSSHLRR